MLDKIPYLCKENTDASLNSHPLKSLFKRENIGQWTLSYYFNQV